LKVENKKKLRLKDAQPIEGPNEQAGSLEER
jgi:hypothetical protein